MDTRPLSTETFSDRPPKPSEWLIGGLLPKGNCAIIGGEPKSYKTWFALTCAIALSSGQSVMRKWKPRKRGKVLLYSPEGQGEGLRRRMYSLCSGMGVEPRSTLANIPSITERVLIDPDDLECYHRLRATVSKVQPDLLIMDPLVHLHNAEENDNVEMQRVLSMIRGIEVACPGLTQMIVHHTSKGGDGGGYSLRGASAIYGWLDTLINITKKDDEAVRRVRIEHRDDIAPLPTEFYLNIAGDGAFSLEPKIGA
jgi:RecA-family ATPase